MLGATIIEYAFALTYRAANALRRLMPRVKAYCLIPIALMHERAVYSLYHYHAILGDA